MLNYPINEDLCVNEDLLAQARGVLSNQCRLYWIVGGAGSGKTTICRALADRFGIPVYDMDAHIYGSYHGRFTPDHHPVNHAWSTAQNGLAWLLQMSWDEFNAFQRAALPEYLDLFTEDLKAQSSETSLLVDGGVWHPTLLAQAIPAQQIVCLATSQPSGKQLWEEDAERRAMKELVYQLPDPDEAWRTFLEFDRRITETILKECRSNNIAIYVWDESKSVAESADKVAHILGIARNKCAK